MEIETRRLLLRPFRDEDAPAMAQALNNYNVTKNLDLVPFPYTLEDAKYFIDFQRSFDPRSRTLAITFRCAPDELIGTVSYKFEPDNDFAEFGYWLRECCWRMGIMTEAATALVRHAFIEAGVEELRSGFWNPISGRVLNRLGFEVTHRAPIFSRAQNQSVDAAKLRLTRESWLAKQESRAA